MYEDDHPARGSATGRPTVALQSANPGWRVSYLETPLLGALPVRGLFLTTAKQVVYFGRIRSPLSRRQACGGFEVCPIGRARPSKESHDRVF
jgi:hypothetical protein